MRDTAAGPQMDRRSTWGSFGLPRTGMARVGAIVLAAALLVWPAWMNGYPIVFIDTAAYLLHTITGEAPWDKTAAYGPFLLLFHQGVTLWLPLAAQGVMLSYVLWLVQRVATGQISPIGHLLLATGLAVLTSAPWFVATLMPDFFTPLVVLCLFLLGFGERRLNWSETVVAGLIGAIAIASHLSHLPTALALIVLVLLVRRQWRPVLRSVLPVLAAILFLLGANAYAFDRVTLSPHGTVFLLARLQADGPAVWTLRDRCPASGWYLCDFIDRMPMDSDRFLWNPGSPPAMDAAGNHRPMGAVLLAPEAQQVISATLYAYPLEVAHAAFGNWMEQLLKTRIGDTFGNTDLDNFAVQVIARGFPARERAAFEAGAQMQGQLERLASPTLFLHIVVLLLSTVALLAGAWRLAWRRDRPRLGLVLCVLVGVAGNAFSTGALSKPHHRYQARIVWLLPLGAALVFWPAHGGVFLRQPSPAGARVVPATSPARSD